MIAALLACILLVLLIGPRAFLKLVFGAGLVIVLAAFVWIVGHSP